MADVDLVVVGGGPAGMAAARTVAAAGRSVAVVDEQPLPGGQILRQPPAAFRVADWLGGRAYRGVKAELAAFQATAGIDWHGGRSAIGAAVEGGGFVVHATGADGMLRLTTRTLLVAAGCYDLPVPLPGWTLPGVMTAGGVQAFVKSQQFVPGDRLVLAGTHPLMLVVAAQIVAGGGTVAAVAFDQPRGRFVRILARHAATAAANSGTLALAAAAWRVLRSQRVPVRFGRPLRAVEGGDRVTAARFDDERVACDAVALCYGFVPQSDLPRMLGATTAWASPAGGWRTCHDAWMRTDVPGLFIAGETSGVAGGDVALAEGRLAGLGLLAYLHGVPADARAAAPIRRRLARLRGFAAMLAEVADPSTVLARAVPPETILCRCEDVDYGTIAAAFADATAPNAIKLATRCGMGLCQGRTCEPALLALLAATTGRPAGAQGGFTARFPARPTRIGDLIAPADVAAAATTLSNTTD